MIRHPRPTAPIAARLALALGLGALAALPLAAQESDSTAGQAQPGGDVSMGTPADAPGAGLPSPEQAAIGQYYFAAAFDAWEQRCLKTEDGADPCRLYQLLKDGNGNAVAEITLFPMPAGQPAVAGANVVAPLETLLTRELRLAIDGAPPKTYPFAFCTTEGCVARVGLTAEEIAAMKKGAAALVTIVPAAAPDQDVVLTVSLKGFTAGFEAVAATAAKE